MVHKPVGVVTTAHDPEGRPTVMDLVPRELGRLFPVGRLDVQSSGLLLLTNDGALAARVTHPRHHVPRVYRVKVSGLLDEGALARLRRGVRLEDGPTGPIDIVVERALPTKTWLRMTVHEGRTHLVRRLCAAVGHSAEKLQRVALGPLVLGHLRLGTFRLLTDREIRGLRAAAGEVGPARAARPARRVPEHAGAVRRRQRSRS
jgi:pseudouridine synthase